MTYRASAPGSVLLLGEYAVLEEGGLGVSLAPAVRAGCAVSTVGAYGGSGLAGEGPAVTARYAGTSQTWPGSASPGCPPIVGAVLEGCVRDDGRLPARIEINTDGFYDGARKLGFGSSAAAAVCLAAALLSASGLPRDEAIRRSASVAVHAHRLAQGGAGSGYDVLTSHGGGVGVFSGGRTPGYRRVRADWLPACYLYRGPREVSTPRAVAAYEEWKAEEPDSAAAFLAASNSLARQLADASVWDVAHTILTAARDLSVGVGRHIGVPAEPALHTCTTRFESIRRALDAVPEGDVFTKSLGAGDETAMLMVRDPHPDLDEELRRSGFRPLEVSTSGVVLR